MNPLLGVHLQGMHSILLSSSSLIKAIFKTPLLASRLAPEHREQETPQSRDTGLCSSSKVTFWQPSWQRKGRQLTVQKQKSDNSQRPSLFPGDKTYLRPRKLPRKRLPVRRQRSAACRCRGLRSPPLPRPARKRGHSTGLPSGDRVPGVALDRAGLRGKGREGTGRPPPPPRHTLSPAPHG